MNKKSGKKEDRTWRRRGRGRPASGRPASRQGPRGDDDEAGGTGRRVGAGQGRGAMATRSGRRRRRRPRGGDGEHGQPGGVDELGVVGGQMFNQNWKIPKSCLYTQSISPGSWHQPGLMPPFGPGSWHQPGPKISFQQPNARETETFGPGWCHEPGPKVWHWSRFVPPTGTNVPLLFRLVLPTGTKGQRGAVGCLVPPR